MLDDQDPSFDLSSKLFSTEPEDIRAALFVLQIVQLEDLPPSTADRLVDLLIETPITSDLYVDLISTALSLCRAKESFFLHLQQRDLLSFYAADSFSSVACQLAHLKEELCESLLSLVFLLDSGSDNRRAVSLVDAIFRSAPNSTACIQAAAILPLISETSESFDAGRFYRPAKCDDDTAINCFVSVAAGQECLHCEGFESLLRLKHPFAQRAVASALQHLAEDASAAVRFWDRLGVSDLLVGSGALESELLLAASDSVLLGAAVSPELPAVLLRLFSDTGDEAALRLLHSCMVTGQAESAPSLLAGECYDALAEAAVEGSIDAMLVLSHLASKNRLGVPRVVSCYERILASDPPVPTAVAVVNEIFDLFGADEHNALFRESELPSLLVRTKKTLGENRGLDEETEDAYENLCRFLPYMSAT